MKEAYKEFIRYSINIINKHPESNDEIDWRKFKDFCCRQGISGIVFAGIERSNIRIPQIVLFDWLSIAESIKLQNLLANRRVLQLNNLLLEKGYRCLVLKGQVNSTMYPHPQLRSPGDIDIWVDGHDIDLIKMVRKICYNAKLSYHHLKMPLFRDISVEILYSPSHLSN